jgi:hypothetical protein
VLIVLVVDPDPPVVEVDKFDAPPPPPDDTIIVPVKWLVVFT